MITRKQYLNKEATYREYYGQFVDEGVKRRVLAHGIDRDRLLGSADEHLNDIPLKLWDSVLALFPKSIGDKVRACGDHPTRGGAVCIAKEAARQIIEEAS